MCGRKLSRRPRNRWIVEAPGHRTYSPRLARPSARQAAIYLRTSAYFPRRFFKIFLFPLRLFENRPPVACNIYRAHSRRSLLFAKTAFAAARRSDPTVILSVIRGNAGTKRSSVFLGYPEDPRIHASYPLFAVIHHGLRSSVIHASFHRSDFLVNEGWWSRRRNARHSPSGTLIKVAQRFSHLSAAASDSEFTVGKRAERGHQGLRFTSTNNLFKSVLHPTRPAAAPMALPLSVRTGSRGNSKPYRIDSSFRESGKAANKWTNVLGMEKGFSQGRSSLSCSYPYPWDCCFRSLSVDDRTLSFTAIALNIHRCPLLTNVLNSWRVKAAFATLRRSFNSIFVDFWLLYCYFHVSLETCSFTRTVHFDISASQRELFLLFEGYFYLARN